MNEVLSRALALTRSERAALAHHLLLSLEQEERNADYEATSTAELETRLAKTAGGEMNAKDGHEAIAEMRRALAKETSSCQSSQRV